MVRCVAPSEFLRSGRYARNEAVPCRRDARGGDPVPAAVGGRYAGNGGSDAAIRIGISPWGFEGEFAVREALEQRYHLLLGGGPGAAFAGEVNAQAPGLIWSRADKDGRSVMAIDIMALPEPGVPFAWEWGLSMQAQEVRLTSAVPSNPHMEALVAGKAAR